MKINFLYWNTNNNNISSYIIEACLENKIDVLILSENKNIDIDYLRRKLKENNLFFKVEKIVPHSRILLLHNTKGQINVIKESKYYSTFNLKDKDERFLIFALHLPSKYAQERSDLNMYTSQILREFEQLEEERKTEKSIVVGDFNMNPFDDGMVSALGFNAVMCPTIAKKQSRKVLNEERKFYYNPMWHIMGNYFNSCKGTFYYPTATKSYYWYTYDQVIIRPELIDKFDINELEVLSIINEKSLLTRNNLPNKKKISDHLPIKFKLELEVTKNNE
ncbi:hypothetical protein [Clostridium taeniosporum]|uniref:Endonuclease/exonuclease/phosphatase n=1 Tax=Clostridium taeniosporum TaxID=394958 RepID=A0A1D7XLD3_9CLOT|nr:hypothetical protein [Clostridium taeniosporum]AOR24141.1 hypothetical protein BGI42_10550 [Clostridium taeniosporum]